MVKKINGFLGKLKVGSGEPVRIIGIINASPESFYGESIIKSPEKAVELANVMLKEGADGIDVGARSTAPYLESQITEDEEVRRIIPILQALCSNFDIPISIDTQRHRVAEQAVLRGATVINDISGGSDPELLDVASRFGTSLIILPQDRGPTKDCLEATVSDLRHRIQMAEEHGNPSSKILVDPGIGFIRDCGIPWYDRDAIILANIATIRELGKPVYVGVSRKSFIGKIVGAGDPSDRLPGSLAAGAIAVVNGADVIRTHDIKPTLQAVRVAEHIRDNSH
ncbi:MAG: dihydropteroate synthase [Candidatus Methanomethylicus sp.]|nr:dihydropteroate synthase [Candidatus Methanomethylicus sp.]